MNENNRSRRNQQAKSSADRRTPSAYSSDLENQHSNIYRYDARITFDNLEEDNEPEYIDIEDELQYEDDGDFLDSQGIQPAPPKVVNKPYRKQTPSNHSRHTSAKPAVPNYPRKPRSSARKPQPNRRPMEWQDEEQFEEVDFGNEHAEFDDPLFEGEVYEDEVYAPAYQYEAGYAPSQLRRPQPVQIIFALVGLMIVGLLLMSRPLTAGLIDRMARTENGAKAFGADANTNSVSSPDQIAGQKEQNIVAGQLSPFFSQSVLYWEADIVRWANRHNLDPNMVATIMQIESCGDPRAQSGAGAMGLFQVMPFHFQAGEDGFDPDTNALRGMNYLAERLIQTGGEIGHAFAGYNGGHAAAASTWSNWANETQRYYKWTTGVYSDSLNGNRNSDTLEQWIVAGGASLCAQAEQRLGLQ